MNQREATAQIALSCVIALVLAMLPLPFWLAVFRPAFLVLVVMYWSTMAPYAGGLLLGFLCGLALDVFQGPLIGQHAFALSLITYLAVRFSLQMRAKPIFEQSLYVLAALVLYEAVLFLIDGFTGRGTTSFRWLYAPVSALIWPLVVGILGRLHTPR